MERLATDLGAKRIWRYNVCKISDVHHYSTTALLYVTHLKWFTFMWIELYQFSCSL